MNWTLQLGGVKCCIGHVLPFGATIMQNGGINFSINSADAEGCELQLYNAGDAEPFARVQIPEEFRIGNNYSILIFDLDAENVEYTYTFNGVMDPASGLRFDPNINLLDPYAKLISGLDTWGEENRPLRCRIIREDFYWEGDRPLELPLEDLIIYEMRVRGFTKESPDCKRKGTYAGVIEMIPYFKKLGVNCVELLPIFEFDELDNKALSDKGERLFNF